MPVHRGRDRGSQVRPVVPGDASESVGLWRETWAETYGPCLGTSRLDGLLPGLAAGTASMLPGWGERGDRLSAGARIIGLSKRLEIRALRTSPGGAGLLSRVGLRAGRRRGDRTDGRWFSDALRAGRRHRRASGITAARCGVAVGDLFGPTAPGRSGVR